MKIEQEHMDKIIRLVAENLIDKPYIGLCQRRPFANSYHYGDILEECGFSEEGDDWWSDEQLKYAVDLWNNIVPEMKKRLLR